MEGTSLQRTIAKGSGITFACLGRLVLFCLAVLPVLAQRYSFREAPAGLGNLNVNCIVQDRSGYLWVGTENGLYRFDGVQYRQFGAADGLRGRSIQNLFTGLDGTLWVGTTVGIYFERADGSFAEVHSPAPVNQFSQRVGTVFASHLADQVVVADRSGGFLLRRLGPEQWVAESMHLEGTAIWSVLYGADGTLWYGCDSDLCHLDNGKTTHLGAQRNSVLRSSERLPEDQWLRLLNGRDGHLWLRGFRHVVEVLANEGRLVSHDFPGQTDVAPYPGLVEDAHGHIVTSQGPALGLWENGRWSRVDARNGLPPYDISAIFMDREGSLWLGIVGHGLRRWLGQGHWESFTVAEGLSNDIVWATLRDREGRLWVGTESGLDWIPTGGNTPHGWKFGGIQTARAMSLAESADGAIWMGTAVGGLVRIDPVTLAGRQWAMPEVYRMLADREDRLWIATGGGLFVVNTAAPSSRLAPTLIKDPGITTPQQRFTDLSVDASNQIWAASDQGLFRRSNDGWRGIDPGLPAVAPYQIAFDHRGNLWATGVFPGLISERVVNDRVIEAQHVSHPPLLSEQVVSLKVDHRGWLWVGQDTGLSVFDGHNWRSFSQDDGLIWNDSNSFALTEDNDGSIWIGTSGGLAHFIEPQTLSAEPPPTPVFSQASYGTKGLSNGTEVAWSEIPLLVSVVAIRFRDPGSLRLHYRLLGLDSEWKEMTGNTIQFSRLVPGEYRFQVTAVELNSHVVSPQAEIDFRILPRWWQNRLARGTQWALGLVTLLFLGRWGFHLRVAKRGRQQDAEQTSKDATQRKLAEQARVRDQLVHFAEYDDLTGLLNHRMVFERLRAEVERARRDGSFLSVVLVDLDHFKEINSTFGHPGGDRVLKEVGSILLRAVRSYDWVGRYSSEEFLLVLPGSSREAANLRAEQLRVAVQEARIHYCDKIIKVTVSLGVASGTPSDEESLMQAANGTLHSAKSRGGNCVVAVDMAPPDRFVPYI